MKTIRKLLASIWVRFLSPSKQPAQYARVELLGRYDMGICRVREIDSLGGKSLEVIALRKDGSAEGVALVEKHTLYMRTAVSEQEALADAQDRYRPDEPISPCTEKVRPVPWEAIRRILEYLDGDNEIESRIAELTAWYAAEQSDIPF